MDKIILKNSIVDNHRLKRFESTLQEICVRDYKTPYFKADVAALDLDEYEKSQKSNNDNTMDSAIGVCNQNSKNERLMLVELKIDVSDPENMEMSALRGKVSHSKDILIGDRIDPNILIVFKTDKAKNKAERIFKNKKEDWIPVTYKELDEAFMPVEKCPYIPITNLDAASSKFWGLVSKDDVGSLIDYTTNLIDRANKYHYSNSLECRAIMHRLFELWNDVLIRHKDSKDLCEYAKMFLQDELADYR